MASQTTAASSFSPAPLSPECQACFGDEHLVSLPCSHSWCKGCISRASTQVHNGQDWPIRCDDDCHLSESVVLESLSAKEARSLKAKLTEIRTAPRERCYCSNKKCGAFIAPPLVVVDDEREAVCEDCASRTCRSCLDAWHEGDCAGPCADELKLLSLIEKEGYQRCSQCRSAVERTAGCPHMTCVCGHEFCYHCGEQIQVCNGCWHLEASTDEDVEAAGQAWDGAILFVFVEDGETFSVPDVRFVPEGREFYWIFPEQMTAVDSDGEEVNEEDSDGEEVNEEDSDGEVYEDDMTGDWSM